MKRIEHRVRRQMTENSCEVPLWERLSSRDQSFRNLQQKYIPEPKSQILRCQVSEALF